MRKRHCEALVQQKFHLHLPVDKFLFDDIETGPTSYAVLFRSGRHMYALFVAENTRQTLGDVKSMMSHMGIKPQKILPPHADPDYFKNEAERWFSHTYPAIRAFSASTAEFYQTYADYTPGLVRIAEIKSPIKRYVTRSSRWQEAVEFSFRKIQVQ